jgi:beta-lactamase class C
MSVATELTHALAIAAQWVDKRVVPGLAIAISRDGEFVAEFYGGKQAAGGGRVVDASTLYPVASVTKPFTATAFMRLVDRGVVGLDEPVRRAVPSFSGSDKRDVSFRELLCHVSGLPKDDPNEAPLWDEQAGFNAFAKSAASLPLAAPPGERVIYSNAGYWVLGAAISALTHNTFADALAAEVLSPFALDDTFISPPSDVYERIARRYGRSKMLNAPYGRRLGSPSAGLFASARDLTKFARVFLASGKLPGGTEVVSGAAVSEMISNQTDALPGGIEGIRIWPECAWGLGWEVKGTKLHHWTGDFTSPATFCHIGQSGALLWADPVTGIACAVLANRDLATDWTDTPARWARFNNAVVAGLTGAGQN